MSDAPQELSLATCTVDTFRPHLETRFDLAAPDGELLALQLIEAVALEPSPAPSISPEQSPAPSITPEPSPAPSITPERSPAPPISPEKSPAPPISPEQSPAPSTAPRAPFSLLFLGPPDPLLAQGTYALTHEALGRVELFLVPVAQDTGGTNYEAVFA